MKVTACVNIRITPAEAESVDLLRQKNITQADIFRRGLEAYMFDIMGASAPKA